MALGNQDTGQRLDGHMVSRQTQGALIDHHRAFSLVDFLFLEVLDSFCRDIEWRPFRGYRRPCSASCMRKQYPQHQPTNQAYPQPRCDPCHVSPEAAKAHNHGAMPCTLPQA
jgi:hypothetical protein